MATEFGTGKTVFILAIVAGCFAVLWPKLFSPMLEASLFSKPPVDNSAGCCDVMSDMDVNAIKILTEMCGRIIHKHSELNPKIVQAFEQGKITQEIVETCKQEVLATCGIDITAFLSEQVRLGQTFRQILDAVRSFNSSVCLKLHFGIERGLLGAPRNMRVWSQTLPSHLRQERPPHPHLRPDRMHPALRERGRAIPPIPQAHVVPRIVEREGRPGPIPGMRPPMGGAGHVVPPPKGTGTMGIVMPLYTIGIIIFFMYTMMKLLFRKSEESESIKNFQPDPEFRRVVFHERPSDKNGTGSLIRGKGVRPYEEHTKLGDLEMNALLRRLEETEAAMERIVAQMDKVPLKPPNKKGNSSIFNFQGENGYAAENRIEEEEPEVVESEPPGMKVVTMEMRASCEGGKPWPGSQPSTPPMQRSRSASRPGTPSGATPPPIEAQAIYLEGALPPASQVLVADSETQAVKAEDENEETTTNDPAVILSGKMTLSLISLDPADLDAEDAAREVAGTPSRSKDEDEEAVEKLEAENKAVENKAVEQEKKEGGGGPPPEESADKEPVTAGSDVTNTLVNTELIADAPVTTTENTEFSQVGEDETGERGGGVERKQEEKENDEETPEHLRPPPLLSLHKIADIEKGHRKISFGGIEDDDDEEEKEEDEEEEEVEEDLPTDTEFDTEIARAMRSEIEEDVRQQIEDIIQQAVNCVFSAQSEEEEEEEEGEEEEDDDDEEVRKALSSESKKPTGHAISKVVTSGIVDPKAVSVSKITLVSPPSESEEEEVEEEVEEEEEIEEEEEVEEEEEEEEEETDEDVAVALPPARRVLSASRSSNENLQRQDPAKPAQNGSVKIAPTGKIAEEESEEEEEEEEVEEEVEEEDVEYEEEDKD